MKQLKPKVRPVAPKAQPVVDQFAVMATFLKALTELYPLDLTKPGICTAYLPGEKMFYASAVRYEIPGIEGKKQVLFSAVAGTIAEAIDQLAVDWFSGNRNAHNLRKLAATRSKH